MIRNFVIGAVGLLALGAFGCGAQGGTGPESTGASSDAVQGSGAWTNMSAALTVARTEPGVCQLDSHTWMVAGGYTDTARTTVSAVANIMDVNVATPAWSTTTASLNTGRAEAKMISLADGYCAIMGGVDNGGNILNSIEIYDRANNAWVLQTATLSSTRHAFAIGKYTSSKVIAAGGLSAAASGYLSSTDLVDTSLVGDPFTLNTSWVSRSAGPTLSVARAYPALANIRVDRILIAGGINSSGTVISSTEAIDATAGTNWADTAMGTARAKFSLSPLSNLGGANTHRGVAIGGLGTSSTVLNTGERFTVGATWNVSNKGTWTALSGSNTTLGTARLNHEAIPTATADGFLIVGGQTSDGYSTSVTALNSSQEYLDGSNFSNAQTFTGERTGLAGIYLSGASATAKTFLTGGLRTQTAAALQSSTFKY